jgi:hypothetical protein
VRPYFDTALNAVLRGARAEVARVLFASERLSYSWTPLPGERDDRNMQFSAKYKKDQLLESFSIAYQSRSFSCLKLICEQLDILLEQDRLSLATEDENANNTTPNPVEIWSEETSVRAYLAFLLTFSLLQGRSIESIALVLSVNPGFLLSIVKMHEKSMNNRFSWKRYLTSTSYTGRSTKAPEPLQIPTFSELSTEELLQRLRVSFVRHVVRPNKPTQKRIIRNDASLDGSNSKSTVVNASSRASDHLVPIDSVRRLCALLNAVFPTLDLTL